MSHCNRKFPAWICAKIGASFNDAKTLSMSGTKMTALHMKRNWFSIFILLAGACIIASVETPAAAAGWAQKQFIITFWAPPPATDENLTRVVAEGFNLTWTSEEGLDVAARHG